MSNIAPDLPWRPVDIRADMAAFDRLPRKLRDALNYAGGEYAASDFASRLPVHMLLARLTRAERKFGFKP